MSFPADPTSADAAPAPPSPPPAAGPDRRRWLVLAALAVAVAGAAGWRYRVTRPEYRLARGEAAVQQRDWDTAETLADRLEASGHPDEAHLLRGEELHARRHPDRALEELVKVRADGPLRVRAAAATGRCLIDLGDLKAAHQVLAFVLAEQPDNIDALRGLAAVEYDLGQMPAAVEHLEAVARLDPADARPYRLIGLIFKDMDRRDKAEAAYREALLRGLPAPAAAEVGGELAEVLLKQSRFADALAALDDHPPDGNEGPARAALRAECLRGVGRRAEAEEVVSRALAEQPSARLYRVRGQLALDAGDGPAAARALERAIDLDPADYQTHYLLGQVYDGLGRKADAARETARGEELRRDLERITTLSVDAMARPWDPAVRLEIAGLCDRLGKPQLAAMWRRAAAACQNQR